MFRLYKNPEAKQWLLVSVVLSIGIGLLFVFLYHTITQQYQSQLDTHLINALAVEQTPDSVLDILQNNPLSDETLNEIERLTQLQVSTPKLNTATLQWTLLLAWGIFSAVLFGTVHVLLQAFYNRIAQTSHFAQSLLENSSPIDIRSYQEGALSQLQNDLYHMAVQLHQSAEKSTQHKQYLAQHIADISHQIKTPLTSLHVLTDQLQLLPVSQREDQYIDLLVAQTDRIEELVQALLLLSRLDADAVTLKQEAINLYQCLATLSDQLNVLAKHKDIQFSITTDDTDSQFIGDTFLISEAIGNVIKNAIDHAEPHSSIVITMTSNIFYTECRIFNKGKAISQDDLPYIFDRFYRGQYANKNGVGIGLSIAYEIIDRHKGKITAENQPDGVCFTITLPK